MEYGVAVSGVGLEAGPVQTVLLGSQGLQQPAAGADWTYTIPDAGAVYELVAIRARFVTSAVVANRAVAVIVKDAAGTEVFREGLDTAVTASLTTIWTFTSEAGTSAGGVATVKAVALGIPEGPYLPRWTISTVTTAIDVGDQWSQIGVWYRALYPSGAYPGANGNGGGD